MPSRLKPSINDFESRLLPLTGLERSNSSKMPRNESRQGSNDSRSKGRHQPLVPVEIHTRIYRISTLRVSHLVENRICLLPCDPILLRTTMELGASIIMSKG